MSSPDLMARLPELTLRDEHRLRRRLDGARTVRDATARERTLAAIDGDVGAAERRVAARRAALPAVTYPADLPVSQRKDDILAAIRDNQVVIVAGETGSGKTTQLPKICLELGRGVRGAIGHTQPRRIAARTVAERIAEELSTPLGEAVGYKVRFTDQSSDNTLVKVMTDGILLAEMQNDRALHQYDTIIVDEAHERSLNVDFILGYLKQLLPRRPDLKLIITSATIDPQRFARHFGDAPIVEVSGRTYPVEVRYRPLVLETARGEDTDDADEDGEVIVRDATEAIADAVQELRAEGPGDVLVFLSGEREIRDTADVLGRLNLPETEIVPLYARLSSAEQHRVFQAHRGRRIVLATNVAETSLTVPGIKYVIDPGTARISRYSHRLKVQRLPIEPISQASANQRKGRCGRVSEGICIRLYAEDDFLARPEYTDPEILRTNLASVILQMTALGLGDVAAFPFMDPPDRRNIADGVQLLQELGAIDLGKPAAQDGPSQRLTPVGRQLAQLPIDPRLARMVLEADRNGCLREVMVIAAALSIQDPRERPVEKRPAADAKHARFADKESDFLTFLNLWTYLREQQRELSSSAFRRMCKADFLNYLRIREWQDLVSQLRRVAGTLNLTLNDTDPDPERVHVSLLAGLLSRIGLKEPDGKEYVGARNAKFAIFPGSALFRKPPRWVMAAELVETSRLWGRVCARIEPEWVEPLAQHLVKRSYSEPHWEKKQAAVMASEKVTLYGVPIVASRKINFGRVDPVLSRELFIRHALVEGDWETQHEFFQGNRELLAEVEELEHRARRRDIVVDDQTLYDFYDARIPAHVVSGRHFDSWWKKARRATPELLTFDKAMLVNAAAGGVTEDDYPDVWTFGGLDLPLSYQFEPGTAADGVTVRAPLAALNQLDPDAFGWQVPGLREDLVTALIRSLPKHLRRNFVPVPDYARAILDVSGPDDGPLLDVLERQLRRLTGVHIPREAWDPARVPDHLKPAFEVLDDDGGTVAEGRDLAALQRQLRPQVRQTLAAATEGIERTGLRGWDFGPLPQVVEQRRAQYAVTAYPALVDEGDTVAVRLMESAAEQARAMGRGTRRLLQLTVPSPVGLVNARLSNADKLTLSRGNPYRSAAELLDDCVAAALDKLIADHGGPAWDPESFARLRDQVRAQLADTVLAVVGVVREILAAGYEVQRRLANTTHLTLLPTLTDLRNQLAGLVAPGFVTAAGWYHLGDLPRYLTAMQRRLERAPTNPDRDRQLTAQVHQVEQEYQQLRTEIRPTSPSWDRLPEIRWMIEELRVNLFAQGVGTAYPVSDKRIYRAMDELAG